MRNVPRRASAEAGDWKETLGRVGLVGKGVLFGIIGILAIQLAMGDSDEQADQGGAIEWLAQQPFGRFLLLALTVCLFALGIWRLLDAAMGDPVEGSETVDRVKYGVQGVAYLAVAVLALTATVSNWSGSNSGSGSGGGDQSSQEATSTVFEWPAGRWLVGIVGLAVIAVALYMFKKYSIDKDFMQRLRADAGQRLERLGQFGYGARSVATAIIGYFLLQAAITYDPDEAKGLSGSLQELAGRGWGQLVLWLVALGLLAFGLFSLAEAKFRRSA